MILSMSDQAISFLAAAAAGAALGIFYDLFRILRKTLRHKTATTAIEDAIFWIVATLFMFIFLLYENFGAIRAFTFLGVALGAILYFLNLSRFFMKFAIAVLKKIKKLILTIISPFAAMFRFVKKRLKIGQRYVIVKRRRIHERMKRRFGHAEQSRQD